MPVPEFAVIGDNCIDRFLPPVDDFLVGGNAVNVAVQMAMLGRSAAYFGAAGDDPAGLAIRDCLIRMGVDVGAFRLITGQKTAYTDIELSEDGERSFVFEEFGACAGYRPSTDDVAALRRMRHVHIGWMIGVDCLKHELAGSGATVSQDLSVNNSPDNLSPAGLDIAFCSAEPGRAEGEARRLLAEGARLAVVTLGAAGSFASDGQTSASAEAPLIVPEDTTGAGDAFIAGFIDAWHARQPLGTCLTRGGERAALACMHRGGFAQEPLRKLF